MPLDASQHSTLLAALARAARAHPLERKLLVGRRPAEGRELLRALALAGVGCAGFEPTTPGALAHELVAAGLAADGFERVDPFDALAWADEAMDEVLAAPDAGPLAALVDGVGFRDAVRRTLEALRLEGITAAELAAAPLEDGRKRDALAAILAGYERRLAAHRRVDHGAILRRALDALERGDVAPPADARILVLPGLGRRGLEGRLVDRLVERAGGAVLETDPVVGGTVPSAVLWAAGAAASPLSWLHAVERAPAAVSLDLFAAASPADELREVLRRVVAAGLRWDEVEIVATDADLYGGALDALARRLGVPVTYAVGLPVERTRQGRALNGYLRWIQEDFSADALRTLLEAGDLEAPDGHAHVSSVALAARLRRLRVGWGRGRYGDAIRRALARLDEAPAGDDARDDDERRAAAARARAELEALHALLGPILEATPPVPGRAEAEPAPVSPADIARGVLACLERVPARTSAERDARERLRRRLERAAATLRRATSFGAALAILRSRLLVRVPGPEGDAAAAPWSAAGGHLHLSDLEHGGLCGRRHTFVVGLDGARFPGAGLQDPVLTDEDRRRLGDGRAIPLATAADGLDERRFALAALLARLRGRVTLGYSAWDALEGRRVAPAAAVLQAFRLASGDPDADYEALHRALGRHAGAVPHGAGRLDAADVWLDALSGPDGVPRAGVTVVLDAFRGLARGLAARAARTGAAATAHHGVVEPRPDRLDPRRTGHVVSPSRLEALGACPHRYLLRYVLRIRPPDDPTFDADAWLDPLARGTLLHAVYEHTLRDARRRGIAPNDPAFAGLAREVLEREAERARERVPPPSEAVRRRELAELAADVDAFVAMTREHGDAWVELELAFGPGQPHPPVALPAGGGAVRVQGRIDRVDRTDDGRLRVIDYKTGSARRYRADAFDGGRRLQHALYAHAAETLLGGEAASAEYHFPTRKAENAVRAYARGALDGAPARVGRLLDLVADGRFVPTDEPDDCRYCDYAGICRVRVDGWGVVDSPLAAWAKERAAELDEYAALRAVRTDTTAAPAR